MNMYKDAAPYWRKIAPGVMATGVATIAGYSVGETGYWFLLPIPIVIACLSLIHGWLSGFYSGQLKVTREWNKHNAERLRTLSALQRQVEELNSRIK